MTLAPTDGLARLRAANPQPIEPDRGRGAAAQAALAQILEESAKATGGGDRRRRRGVGGASRRLVVVFALLLVGGGAAVAATDPLGWWSPNPGQAMYGSNPAVRVRTPSAQQIGCTRWAGAVRCSTRRSGQLYARIDAIHPPVSGFTRVALLRYIAGRRVAGTMTAAQAARFRADLAAVPNSFFTKYQLGSRYGTYGGGGETGNGRTLVPPPGVPEFLVCETTGAGLSCQDLNGDASAPIGAGVYQAIPARDWHLAPPQPANYGRRPPGISFTSAEYRVLVDMVRFATVSTTSGSALPPRSTTATSSK